MHSLRFELSRIERSGPWLVLRNQKYHGDELQFTGLTALAYGGGMVGFYPWS